VEIDWEEPRVKRTLVLSCGIPGLAGFAAYLANLWVLAALFAAASGIAGGLTFGRRLKSRLLYVIPSTVTALATVGVMWLAIRLRPSVYFVELFFCLFVAGAGTLPLWAVFYGRLDEDDDPRAARRAAFRAATRRDD